jgi:8-oxo-dGTP diphosphatase
MNGEIELLDRHLDDPHGYTFAIVAALYHGRWIWVRHRDRQTWELPAGHVEPGETATQAARRELYEETGALDFTLVPVVSYRGDFPDQTVYGLVFLAVIRSIGPLPEHEIAEISMETRIPEVLTYPMIQPLFFQYVLDRIDSADPGN